MMLYESTEQDAYELFRHAIVGRSNDAWAALHTRYYPLMLSWSRQSCIRFRAAVAPEDVAEWAFSRAWVALTPQHFEQFCGLGPLLGYLRSCVAAAVIDEARATFVRERAYQRLQLPSVPSPEDLVVGSALRGEVWRQLSRQVTNEADWVVLLETFVNGLPPRDIQRLYPYLFADTQAVYAAKRNLLSRLQRCAGLRRLFNELAA